MNEYVILSNEAGKKVAVRAESVVIVHESDLSVPGKAQCVVYCQGLNVAVVETYDQVMAAMERAFRAGEARPSTTLLGLKLTREPSEGVNLTKTPLEPT